MNEHTHTLKGGFLHRDGVTLQCPFRTPSTIVLPGGLIGKQPDINIIPLYCGLLCPLFEHKATTVRLLCGCAPVTYHVEVITPPNVHKLANA